VIAMHIPNPQRRRIVTALAAGAAGLGTPLAAQHAVAAEQRVAASPPRGYRDTPHVRKYYRSTRL